jgi:hypothetical protein
MCNLGYKSAFVNFDIENMFDICTEPSPTMPMEQQAFKNVNICLNTNIYSYLETSGGQSSNLHLNVVHFFQQQC